MFPRGELVQYPLVGRLHVLIDALVLQHTQHPRCRFWCQHCLPGIHQPDSVKQLLGLRVFQQKATGPRLNGTADKILIVKGRQHDHFGVCI